MLEREKEGAVDANHRAIWNGRPFAPDGSRNMRGGGAGHSVFVNGGAQIGKVVVTGDWAESNLVAGVKNTASGNTSFGDGNDAAIATGSPSAIAKITSVSIGGIISGTTGGTDHFGFVAHLMGKFAMGGIKIPLGASPSSLNVGSTPDVSVHLI